MSHAARAIAQGHQPWPSDDKLAAMMDELGSVAAVARACGKARESLRDYLRLRPELQERLRGLPAAETALRAQEHRSARARRQEGLREASEWVAILAADPCSYCGAPAEVADHIQALARGGAAGWENLAGACFACNSSKGTRTLLMFLLESPRGVECPIQSQQDQ